MAAQGEAQHARAVAERATVTGADETESAADAPKTKRYLSSRGGSGRWVLFWGLFVVLIVAWVIAALWEQPLRQWAQGTLPLDTQNLFDDALRRINSVLLPAVFGMALVLAARLVWLLAVHLVWPSSDQQDPVTRARLGYAYIWIVGLGLVGILGPWLADSVAPRLRPPVDVYAFAVVVTSAAMVSWTSAVVLWLIVSGDGSPEHDQFVRRHWTIWTLLILILVADLLVNMLALQSVRERVNGLRSTVSLAVTSLNEVEIRTTDATDTIFNEILLPLDNTNRGLPTWQGTKYAETRQSLTRDEVLESTAVRLPVVRFQAMSANNAARNAVDLLNATQSTQSTSNRDRTVSWLDQPRKVVTLTERSTAAVVQGLNRAGDELQGIRNEDGLPGTTHSLTQLVGIAGADVYRPVLEAKGEAAAARGALLAVDVPVLALFLWVAAFYTVVLIIPWVLLLLFFVRKRERRATQILDDLVRLDPELGLLERALGLGRDAPSREQQLRDEVDGLRTKLELLDGEKPKSGWLARQDAPEVNNLVEHLAARAFNNLEYALALILLTILLALGWYFVFYPDTTAGLASLIQRGAGIDELTTYLSTPTPSPLTLGFVGAYFWAAQMLLRRYLAGDLYPAAFLQATERFVLVFILGMVLSAVAVVAQWAAGVTPVVAFLAGIYPRAGLAQTAAVINRLLGTKRFPESLENAPLTQLDGIDIWIETRLVEERVENVQSMATVEIELLVLKTHFPTKQIVDWVDQAILCLHAGGENGQLQQLRAAGVRTASDLLDTAEVLGTLAQPVDPSAAPGDEAIARLAVAMQGTPAKFPHPSTFADGVTPASLDGHAEEQPAGTSANGAAATSTDGRGLAVAGEQEHVKALSAVPAAGQTTANAASRTPAPDARLAATLRVICDALWPDPNIAYVLNFIGYRLSTTSGASVRPLGQATAAPVAAIEQPVRTVVSQEPALSRRSGGMTIGTYLDADTSAISRQPDEA